LLLPVLLMAMLTGIEPLASDLRLRLILSSVEIAVFAAAVLRDARRAQRSEPLRMRQVAMGLYLSTLLVGLIRLAVVLHDVDMPPDYLDRRSPEAPFALVLMVVALAWNFSITLMVGERMEARLQGLAHTDPLSGLLNRAGFRERSRRQLERARRELKPVSVMLLDLDHFKRINDTYGHDAGDAMLAGFAKLLQETVRPGDLTSRHGGEEFCALLPGADAPAAAAVAERIRARFEQLRVPAGPDRIGTTVCIGVAQWAGGDETIERALKRADAALYSAKREGRNRVVLAAAADGVAAAPA
jgi:diguanylate cyclase (GGDEF)-like protein